ncbi:MAG: HAD family phosphatase [bacterium]|nr:HAD family phosphatase [bacterium]
MSLEYWFVFPVSILFATIAMASGVEGATFFLNCNASILLVNLSKANSQARGLCYASWTSLFMPCASSHLKRKSVMIQAVIFDLDGTLVQTEILKAQSYAGAALQLADGSITETEVMEAFVEVVGRSRREVAEYLLQRFGLEEAAAKRMSEFGVATPWQAFVQVRLEIYNGILENPAILKNHLCPYNLALLRKVRAEGCRTGLATMSHCEQTGNVLRILEITDMFDFIATRDDVETGKPDPEIYLLAASQLAVDPGNCLVIEDSVAGIKSRPCGRDALHRGDQ